MKDYTCYSGGAKGSDSYWKEIALSFGIGEFIEYPAEVMNHIGYTSFQEIEKAYVKSLELIKRTYVPYSKDNLTSKLVRRNYLQVKEAQGVFAIIEGFDGNIPKGGTAYAVVMGIQKLIPVYVFNQVDEKWYSYTLLSESWTEINIPTLTKHFAGVGTRNLTDAGRVAILDVFIVTMN